MKHSDLVTVARGGSFGKVDMATLVEIERRLAVFLGIAK